MVSRTGLGVLGVPDRRREPWWTVPRGGLGWGGMGLLWTKAHHRGSLCAAGAWLRKARLLKEGVSDQKWGAWLQGQHGEDLLSPCLGVAPEARLWLWSGKVGWGHFSCRRALGGSHQAAICPSHVPFALLRLSGSSGAVGVSASALN